MKKFAIPILCLFILAACGGTDHKSTPPAEKYSVRYIAQSESGCFTHARINYDDQNGRHYIEADLPFAYNFECIEGDFLYISVDPVVDPNCQDCTDLEVKIKYLGCAVAWGWMPQPGDRWITACYAFHVPDTMYYDY